MRSTPARSTILLLTLVVLAAAPACTQPKPEVLCVMKNPQTGKTVTMYKEIPFKVPADYDEPKHIAQWKQAQALKGFTEEVTASP